MYSSLTGSSSSVASNASSASYVSRGAIPRTRPSPAFSTSSLPDLQPTSRNLEDQVSEVPIDFDTCLALDIESEVEVVPPRAAQRRQRSPGDEAAEEAKRPCVSTPSPHKAAIASAGTFAQAARTPPNPAAPKRTAPSSSSVQTGAGPTTPSKDPPKQPKKPRYPPLVVEKLPSWARHFRAIRDKLGRAPSARPYGAGVRFTPQNEDEYRLVQRYLTELEKEENVVWFSYSLPAERNLKVAIRGLPVDTDPEDIAEELRALGYEPEYVRHIKARQGRPGCIFHAVIKKTANLTPGIYQITELLCMPGVKIEAWRGKQGPAQCHRCQGFRHSSQLCHRPLACVKCGGAHPAKDCPRPREEPATCKNCGGAHPANSTSCPILRREVRNRRAGTVAISGHAGDRESNPHHRRAAATQQQQPLHHIPQGETESATLMAAANEHNAHGVATSSQGRRRRRRGNRKKKNLPVVDDIHAPDAARQPDQTAGDRNARTIPSAATNNKNSGGNKTMPRPPPPRGAEGEKNTATLARPPTGGATYTQHSRKAPPPPARLLPAENNNPHATLPLRGRAELQVPPGSSGAQRQIDRRATTHYHESAGVNNNIHTTQQGTYSPDTSDAIIEAAIRVLQDVLLALRRREDPVRIVLNGLATLINING